MADDEEEGTGVDIQSVSFRVGEGGSRVVEITYAEHRDQRRDIALYKVLIFDETKALNTVGDLVETLEDLVDEILVQQTAVARTRPGRRA